MPILSGGIWLSVSKTATFPLAWTPESVLLAPMLRIEPVRRHEGDDRRVHVQEFVRARRLAGNPVFPDEFFRARSFEVQFFDLDAVFLLQAFDVLLLRFCLGIGRLMPVHRPNVCVYRMCM